MQGKGCVVYFMFLYIDLSDYVPYNKNAYILSFTEAEKMNRNILKRLLMYIAGLFVMTILIFIKSLGSVGIGTIIAAVLVGMELGVISKQFGEQRDSWLEKN